MRRQVDKLPRLVEGPIQQDWVERGSCVGGDVDLWFPKRDWDSGAKVEAAKAICAACPVRVECLEYALVNAEQYGIWGGMGREERRAIRRARGMVA